MSAERVTVGRLEWEAIERRLEYYQGVEAAAKVVVAGNRLYDMRADWSEEDWRRRVPFYIYELRQALAAAPAVEEER